MSSKIERKKLAYKIEDKKSYFLSFLAVFGHFWLFFAVLGHF